MTQSSDWQKHLTAARKGLASYVAHLAALTALRDEATAEVLALGREAGIELNADAVKASIEKPYVLRPTSNPNTWEIITWRGRDVPAIGWVKAQTPGFTISEITRAMDVVSPAPPWMREAIGWPEPQFQAFLADANTAIKVTQGDRAAFRQHYRAYLGEPTADGYRIKKGRAWLDFVGLLLNDGILPYPQTPVAKEHWDASAPCPITLRPYQERYVQEFLAWGSCAAILPSGAGKTYIMDYIAAHIVGPIAVFTDSSMSVEYWRGFLKENAPKADATVFTYQGGEKALKQKWVLALFDEFHRLPASTWSRYAFLETLYRGGGSATPWRNERESFLVLAGRPVAIPWKDLIDEGVLKKPHARIVLVPSVGDKEKWIRAALARHKSGRALIYAEGIQYGTQLANAMDLPFIHGETTRKLERLLAEPVAVVSKVAEQSIDLPDLTLVISADISRTGNSRAFEGQLYGRLLHSHAETGGDYYVLLTPDELARYRERFLGVSSELGDAYELVDLTGSNAKGLYSVSLPKKSRAVNPERSRAAAQSKDKPKTEADAALVNFAVARWLDKVYAKAPVQVRQERKIHAVLKLGWDAPISLEELEQGKGLSRAARGNYLAAFRVAEQEGLMTKVGDGWMTDKKKIARVIEVSQRVK